MATVNGVTTVVDLEQNAISTLARELLASWHAQEGRSAQTQRRRPTNPARLAVVAGLSAHAHYVGEAALDLLDDARTLAALPLVRACYEAAVSAQWVAQTVDGYLALVSEELRQRTNLAQSMAAAPSVVFREAADTVTGPQIDLPSWEASARQFHDICKDLRPGGEDAYVIYRSLSHQSHASVLVIDQYLNPTSAQNLSFSLRPREPEGRSWILLVTMSLVWAGLAMDYLDAGHSRRKQLRSVAKTIGSAPDLHLSDRAVVREAGLKRRP